MMFGVCLLLIGGFVLLCPNRLASVNQFLNQKIFDDSAILSHRMLAAVICVAVGGTLLLLYFGQQIAMAV